jgi:hypothetical protein
MVGSLQDLIPGLREAVEQYRSEAFEAFAGVEPKIFRAIEIQPLTARMFMDLEGGECAFVAKSDRPVDERDIGVFLWRCSPYYQRGNEDLRRLFQASLVPLPFEDVRDEIFEYLRRSLAGMPLWKGKLRASPGVGQWQSRIVHMFAKEYGWTEDYILDLPLRRLWQYANRIVEDADPAYKEQAPAALKLRAEFLTKINAQPPATPGLN